MPNSYAILAISATTYKSDIMSSLSTLFTSNVSAIRLINSLSLFSALATIAFATAGANASAKEVSSNTSYASTNALNTTSLVNNSLETPSVNATARIS